MANKQNDGKSSMTGSDFVYLLMALAICSLILWFALRAPLVWSVTHLRSLELLVIGVFIEPARSMRAELGMITAEIPNAKMSFLQFHQIIDGTGYYARWLWMVIMGPPALLILFAGNKMDRYKRSLTPESLARKESVLWPEITPTINLTLSKGDITKGKWAVAKTEWEFANAHKLTDSEKQLKRSEAKTIFALQLGAVWRGPNAMPKHARAIYAALSLCIAGHREESIKRFRQMAQEFGSDENGSVDNMDLSWMAEAIHRTRSNRVIELVQKRHAYNFTVLASMLQVSRSDGVMASAMMIWVRPVDRRLWYVLNGVGRYTFCVEAAGIMAHWLFEKTLATKILIPCVDKAVEGFEDALAEFVEEDEVQRLLH